MRHSFGHAGLFFILSLVSVFAATPAARFEVQPSELKLETSRATRQLVVTALIDGESRDVTHLARIRSDDEKVARVNPGGVVVAVGNGQATVTIDWEGQTLRVPARVTHHEEPDPVQFKFEAMAVLTKQGCATGSCHGSPQGKAGFSLSLFGYDPTIDQRSLTRDGFNRRLNLIDPTESLLLKKPLLEIAHVGGKRLRHGETSYETLLRWIAEGANVDLPAVECERIVVTPATERVLTAPFLTQQLSVMAHYSDGRVRDVTAIATYDSSNADLASVNPRGLVTGRNRGQAAISVRYLSHLQSVHFTVIENVADFAWRAPAERNFVDRLVNAKLRQLQFLPAETCDDATFLRRLYLDLTGLVPTAEEARGFIEQKDPEKRAKLIDRLLETEAFARFWSLKQADLMRVSKTRLSDGRAEAFAAWLVDAQRKDMPYDQFARKLLTASGDTRKVPEAGFFVAIPGAEERTEMTAQLFLGSRLECAKCHNHPYEKWTMRDYYSLSAVFARTGVDQGVVQTMAKGETLHPTTKEPVSSWGTGSATPAAADRRADFASWLTQPENPLFARVEVNRIWSHLFGRGIVDPVDDFRSSNPQSNGPLLNALAAEFGARGYSRKHIIRLICNSQTYQRGTDTNAFNASDESLFSHARPRLLSAEQLKDAVGLAARALAPVSGLPQQIQATQRTLAQRGAELDAAFPEWIERARADANARDFWMGAWYAVGPFTAAPAAETPEEVFEPERGPVNFSATFDEGRRSWRVRPEWNDPEATHQAEIPKDTTLYLAREIYSSEARTVQVALRGATAVWNNGKSVVSQPVRRERRVSIPLEAGVNRLMMKIASTQDENPFRFRPTEPAAREGAPARLPLLPQVIGLLVKPAEQFSAADRDYVRGLYWQMDETYRDLERRLAAQQQHMEYATQRPYPEAQPFMAAFGQPKRETACSCERSSAPTLLQALELLNGSVMHQAVQAGTDKYLAMEDDALLDELYLSALARFPSGAEREAGKKFLAGGGRSDAVMDLLWALLNTREFLFQH